MRSVGCHWHSIRNCFQLFVFAKPTYLNLIEESVQILKSRAKRMILDTIIAVNLSFVIPSHKRTQ